MRGIFLLISSALFISCKDKTESINRPYANIDSIVVIKKQEGQAYEYAKRFTILDKSVFDTIYRGYINQGLHLRDYYIKLPINKYDLRVYRSDFKNDTIILYHDLMRIRNFIGVINLQRDMEPLLNTLFTNDSLNKIK